jgi:hypothetical protein
VRVGVKVAVNVGVFVFVGGTSVGVSDGVFVKLGAGVNVSVAVGSSTTTVVLSAVGSVKPGRQAKRISEKNTRMKRKEMDLILFFPY